ncbi:MAG: hypothetical protein CL917_06510 [Deltaproteobacteria bacterium]|nr:hypothetical protein [Deltaproteobacteria bacterium]
MEIKKFALGFLVSGVAFFVLGFGLISVQEVSPPVPAPSAELADRLSFMAVGRQGYDNSDTKRIAASMESLAAQEESHFTILAGDNFYPKGVDSVVDAQWQTKFENLYDGVHLRGMPFYAVPGNHDYRGNLAAQIEYSKNKTGSGRWRMDAPYYARDFGKVDDRLLMRVIFLDTVSLRKDSLPQVDFLLREMSKPGDPIWRIVVGHYPTRSLTDNDFSRDRVLGNLISVLKAAEVDLYISANDRFQQVLQRSNEPLHVSTNGGGEKVDPIKSVHSETDFIEGQPGFAHFVVEPNYLKVEMMDLNGMVSYEKELEK